MKRRQFLMASLAGASSPMILAKSNKIKKSEYEFPSIGKTSNRDITYKFNEKWVSKNWDNNYKIN